MPDTIRLDTARDSGKSSKRAGPEALCDIGPSSTVVALDEDELSALRKVGVRWEHALAGP